MIVSGIVCHTGVKGDRIEKTESVVFVYKYDLTEKRFELKYRSGSHDLN
jgi:hypothetical protein